MNIKQAKEEIKHTVQAYLAKDASGAYRILPIRQRPILLMGPPGIGKTQIMEQIARECRIGLVAYTITHHTRQSAVGLPFIKEETFDGKTCSVTEYTMSEIIASVYHKIQLSSLSEGILFIDEINCVSETLAPTMLQFLQCKTVGNQPVPNGWIIVAAGNPPEYNRSVREFDMVTLDRVRCINLEADLHVWREYALEVSIHRAILSYLELRPKNFYRVEADVDGLQFVTARGWEDLSNLLEVYEDMGLPMGEEIVYEFLRHGEVAEDFAAYLDLYRKYQDDYGIPDILNGKVRAQVYARIQQAAFDERLAVVNLLLNGIQNQFRRVSRTRRRTDLWFGFLKDYRGQLNDAKEPRICYQRLLEQRKTDLDKRVLGGLLGREEEADERWLNHQLTDTIPAAGMTPQAAFAQAKSSFDAQSESLVQEELAASIALEHAFDFMEQAFDDSAGQEMVVFVTDLTMNRVSAAFLTEHTCERYLTYNEQLLIGTRRAQLLSELSRDDIK